jgi:hypothetical protein
MSRFALLFTEQEASFPYPTRNFATLGTLLHISLSCNTQAGRGWVVSSSAQLSTSPWRSDHLITREGVWRMASGDSDPNLPSRPFLLIARTGRIVTAHSGRVAPDTRVSQHIARFCNRPIVDGYSYRRRLPGLSFRASPSEDG